MNIKTSSQINSDFEQIKNKISNPNTFGPGIWYCIHTMAKDATTEEKKIKFKSFVEQVISSLPCQTCLDHAIDYYKSNPLDRFWNISEDGEQIGLFKWTWTFHNTVNNRLKKPFVSWENAKMLYSKDTGVCTSSCGDTEKLSQPSNINISIKEEPIQRFIPKNIIRPNSIEKKSNRFRNV
jgi:hypothetical protein